MRRYLQLSHLTKHVYWILAIFFLSGIIACTDSNIANTNKVEIEEENTTISATVQETISAMGFNPEGVEEIGGYYVVEGDIAISKATIEQGVSVCEQSKSLAKSGETDPIHREVGIFMNQWVSNSTIVNISKVSNVTYSIDSSIPSSRIDEIEDGIDMWNNVNGSRVQLSETTSNPDIKIYAYGSAPSPYTCLNGGGIGTLGIAMFPESGDPGKAITVNITKSDILVKMTTVHELGHALGFRHSNWQSKNEEQSGSACGVAFNAFRVAHTLTYDSNSVMNSGPPPTALSFYDERALRIMYPNSLNAPYDEPEISEIHCGPGGGRSFTVSYPLYNTAQNIEVWNKIENGSWQFHFSANAENTESTPAYTSFADDPNVYVKIRKTNYAGDYVSSFSPVLHSPPACD